MAFLPTQSSEASKTKILGYKTPEECFAEEVNIALAK
jgi:hypothetical protein